MVAGPDVSSRGAGWGADTPSSMPSSVPSETEVHTDCALATWWAGQALRHLHASHVGAGAGTEREPSLSPGPGGRPVCLTRGHGGSFAVAFPPRAVCPWGPFAPGLRRPASCFAAPHLPYRGPWLSGLLSGWLRPVLPGCMCDGCPCSFWGREDRAIAWPLFRGPRRPQLCRAPAGSRWCSPGRGWRAWSPRLPDRTLRRRETVTIPRRRGSLPDPPLLSLGPRGRSAPELGGAVSSQARRLVCGTRSRRDGDVGEAKAAACRRGWLPPLTRSLCLQSKVHQFCSRACADDYKKLHCIVAYCEYCQEEKTLHEAVSVSGAKRPFCSEGKCARPAQAWPGREGEGAFLPTRSLSRQSPPNPSHPHPAKRAHVIGSASTRAPTLGVGRSAPRAPLAAPRVPRARSSRTRRRVAQSALRFPAGIPGSALRSRPRRFPRVGTGPGPHPAAGPGARLRLRPPRPQSPALAPSRLPHPGLPPSSLPASSSQCFCPGSAFSVGFCC